MIFDTFNLKGKTAVVTGSNTGLGQGMAIALAEAGASIVGVYRSDIHETEKLITEMGGSFFGVKADLLSTEAVPKIMDAAVSQFGSVDILVNNAGIILRKDAVDFTENDWDSVMNVNLRTLFFLSQAFAKRCIAQGTGGKIINTASLLSFQGGIRVPSYTASKHGVIGLTRLMANEWAPYGINVNAIAPGYMITNNTEALRNDKKRYQEILERIPAGRWGEPGDMAGPVVFLASDASNYIHGYTIAVDGGWLAR